MRCKGVALSRFFTVASLFIVTAGCGGTPPPQAPTAAKPAATVPPPPPPDLSAVPDPQTLVVSGRVARLGASLTTVHGWSKLPMPQSEQVTEIITSEAVGPIVDLDQPIDFAVAVVGSGARMKDLTAVSAAVKDPEKVKATLAERYKLFPGDNGALLIQGLGRPVHRDDADDEDDDKGKSGGDDPDAARTCELAPAYGAAPVRLVCGWNARALAELGPWLTRTATRAGAGADLHVDVRMAPLKPTIAEQKRLLGMILGSVLGGRLGLSSARDLAAGVGGDLADFATDLDSMALDVQMGDAGAQATATLKLSGATSALGRVATGHPERSGPAPAAFWQLPGDADVALFERGIDEAELAKARDLLLQAVSGALSDVGLKDADRKPIVDAFGKVSSSAALVYGSGVDAAEVRKALAAGRALGDKGDPAQRAEAKRETVEALIGWRVIELDEPSAKLAGALKELSAALGKPGVAAAYHAKSKELVPPSFHVAAVPKAAALPAGAQHYVLELHLTDRRPAPPRSGPIRGTPANAAPAGKPLLVHVFVVPDGQRTWVGAGGDEAIVAAKLAASLGAGGDKLAARPELASLKNGSVGAGGFVTARGLPEAAQQMALLFSGSTWGATETFDEAAQLPHQGLVPVVFSVTAQQGATPPPVVATVLVPTGAIEDVVTAILRRGGF
ncbi:MAG TPA: hypothetical protein VIF15_14645 [Polyangiaceae bacterium]